MKARRFFCLARQTAKPFAGYAGCGALRAVFLASRPAASLGLARVAPTLPLCGAYPLPSGHDRTPISKPDTGRRATILDGVAGLWAYDARPLYRLALGHGGSGSALRFDGKLAAYLLNPSASG